MRNETYDTQLLREWTAEPLEGHHVVVFERMGTRGERFQTVLPPGTALERPGRLRSMFRPKVNSFGFAVQAAPELQADWSEHVVTSDHAHEVDLLFTLGYCVEDPALVATSRTADPLGTVRRKVGAVVAGELASVPWQRLWDSFRASADRVVQDNLRPLRAFAAQYGLGIRSIAVGLQLPEAETSTLREVERGTADKRRRTQLELVNLEEDEVVQMERTASESRLRAHALLQSSQYAALEDQASIVEMRRKLLRDLSEANSTALGNIGRKITTGAEWRDALRTGKSALHEMAGDSDPPQLGGGPSADPSRLLAEHAGGAQAQGRLAALVSQAVAATEDVSPTGTRNRLCAALLHLAAEVLADGDAPRVNEYAQAARQAVARLDPPPAAEVQEILRRLADADEVRGALSSL